MTSLGLFRPPRGQIPPKSGRPFDTAQRKPNQEVRTTSMQEPATQSHSSHEWPRVSRGESGSNFPSEGLGSGSNNQERARERLVECSQIDPSVHKALLMNAASQLTFARFRPDEIGVGIGKTHGEDIENRHATTNSTAISSFPLAKLELEASALEKQHAVQSALVTRAALQDAMHVLDENRELKQRLAFVEGIVSSTRLEGLRAKEDLETERARAHAREQEQDGKIEELEHEVMHLLNMRQCLREEASMLRRHCYLLSDTVAACNLDARSPEGSKHRSVHDDDFRDAVKAQKSAPHRHIRAYQRDNQQATPDTDLADTKQDMEEVCKMYGVNSASELESILFSYLCSNRAVNNPPQAPSSGSTIASTHTTATSPRGFNAMKELEVEVRQKKTPNNEMETFVVKGVVERVFLDMPWPKTSASPMVLPSDYPLWGDISRMASIDTGEVIPKVESPGSISLSVPVSSAVSIESTACMVASDQSAKNQSDGGGCGALSSRNDHVEIGTSPVSSSLSQTLSTVKKEERLSQPPTTLSHRSTPIQRSPSNHWRPLSPTASADQEPGRTGWNDSELLQVFSQRANRARSLSNGEEETSGFDGQDKWSDVAIPEGRLERASILSFDEWVAEKMGSGLDGKSEGDSEPPFKQGKQFFMA